VSLVFAAAAIGSACGESTPPPPDETRTTDILMARNTGLTFLQQDRLAEAEAEFIRLTELAPGEASGHASLARVYLRGGDLELAESAIRSALAADPEDPDARLTLAAILEAQGDPERSRGELEQNADRHPEHARTLYALARLAVARGTAGAVRERTSYLSRLVAALPSSPAARLELAEVLLETGQWDEAVAQLEALRQQAPDFPPAAAGSFEEAIRLARGSETAAARTALTAFRRYFELTPPYQAAVQELRGPAGELSGQLDLVFSHEFSLQVQAEDAVLAALRFTDATDVAGLAEMPGIDGPAAALPEGVPPAVLAVGDHDGDGDADIFAATASGPDAGTGFLFRSDLGRFVETSADAGLGEIGLVTAAAFGDFDSDRRLDLFVVDSEVATLYHNERDGFFSDVTGPAGVSGAGGGNRVLFVDLDLDGDLDLYVARAGLNQFYRNNGDGTFQERARAAGVTGRADGDSRDLALADFDNDRDVDLLVANANGPLTLFLNERGGRFSDATGAAGLDSEESAGGGAVAVGDYDNDGDQDIFVAGLEGTHRLFANVGDGKFQADQRSAAVLTAIGDLAARDAEPLDFDNDGHLDLIVAGHRDSATPEAGAQPASRPGLVLLRNDGSGQFEDAGRFLPDGIGNIERLAVADYNEDGDLDLYMADSGGRVRLLRNDGGNVNHYFKIELTGLGEGSRKNNRFGIGSFVEVRAGDLYQARPVTGQVTHFGLGGLLKADVVRVHWTNGVSQDLFFPGSDQDLIEEQTLKGSCPLVYAWNGEAYEFVTDAMWKSALGMPMGIMGARGEREYAPAGSSREYLKLPGSALRLRDGRYSLRLTEELWETIYLDEIRLLAVDHPDSIDVFVDERFVPPGPVELRVFQAGRPRSPVSAIDDRGNDLLESILRKDDVYAASLVPGRFQGIAETHDLILDLGDLARAERVVLYLNGWVFPTDASINVAMAQTDRYQALFPELQVLEDGNWTTVEALSIPSGKNKTIVADLSGKLQDEDTRVRIRTNMQVYWDHVFFTAGPEPQEGGLAFTELTPDAADLRFRGFSRVFRKGGRYGPHWFYYSDVSSEPKWADLEGYYTRYGDVLPLLTDPDDMYVIMNAGDEVAVEFDAAELPPLPAGWSRDFLLYTDGWIKDGDLNTGAGQTVEPLPFHAQSRYPYGAGEGYPEDELHRAYRREYNTRYVRPEY
jgi:Tfp pilus assembly protein PilF